MTRTTPAAAPRDGPSLKALLLSVAIHAAACWALALPDVPRQPSEPVVMWIGQTNAAVRLPTLPRTDALSRQAPRPGTAAQHGTEAASSRRDDDHHAAAPTPPWPEASPVERTDGLSAAARGGSEPSSLTSPSSASLPTMLPAADEGLATAEPGTSPPADAARGPSQEALAAYLAQLVTMLEARVQYPLQARRLQWEGRSLVRCTVSREGGVRHVSLAASSGRALLDSAALRACRDLGNLPPYPIEAGETLTLEIPVTFQLK